MTWVLLDDSFGDHPKVVAAGPHAAILQVRALCYSNRHLTDGFIPTAIVASLCLDLEPGDWPTRMIAAGLWEIAAGPIADAKHLLSTSHDRQAGYTIHDYLDFNSSKRKILALRKAKKDAGRKGAKARWHRPEMAPAIAAASTSHASSQCPTPTPTPSPSVERTAEATTLSGTPRPTSPPNGFKAEARMILDFLNEKAGRTFRPVPANLTLIEARLKSGATVAQCRGVVARKCREWRGNPEIAQYLRPATLFNATKFEQYLGEREPTEAPDARLPGM